MGKKPRSIEAVARDVHMTPWQNKPLSADPIIRATQQHGLAFLQWCVGMAQGVRNESSLRIARDAIQAGKTYRDGIEAHRLNMVAEPKRHLKRIDAEFGLAKQAFDDAVEHLQRAAGEYVASQRRIAENASNAADHAFAAGREGEALAHLAVYNEHRTDTGGILGLAVEVEIIDPDGVPREYCEPSESKLKAAKRADPNFEHPSVRFTTHDRLTVRKKAE